MRKKDILRNQGMEEGSKKITIVLQMKSPL